MLHILIDGYNLIGTAHKDLNKARNDLIHKILSYSRIKEYQITVVFDGWKDGQLRETRIRTGNVTVMYSKLGEKADDVIMRLIRSSKPPIIVVSSDREIADFAEKKDCPVISSDEFEIKLMGNCNQGVCEKDEAHAPSERKSPSKKISIKERRRLNALRRL